MNCTLNKFLQLYEQFREDNSWDFKRQIETSKKSEKYNLIKDFISFANYGGGYILIGIDKDNRTVTGVENELDPATIGNIVETNAGINIKFELGYFSHNFDEEVKKIGLIYIYPSDEALACTKDLTSEDGRTIIVRANDIYTRRHTQSTKANPKEIKEIFYRSTTKQTDNEEISEDKYSVYNSSKQLVDTLWNLLNNEHEVNAETVAINLRVLLRLSNHSKKDFAKLCGITLLEFENLLFGKELPNLDFLMRVSKITGTSLKFFFETTYYGREAFWKDNHLRFSILKLIKPSANIQNIHDCDKFLGNVVYQTAKSILNFYEFINSIRDIEGLSTADSRQFRGELATQHYKLLEQIPQGDYEFRGLTKTEEVISLWFACSSKYLCRIFIESIKEIEVTEKDKPTIVFYFENEINMKEIYGRTYDDVLMKMTFSERKFPTE